MTIEKCINEFDVDDVIFEEGSTGRELFVVLDGKVEIAKMNGASKTVIVTLGKGEFFGEMAVIDGSARSATAIAAAPNTKVMRINHARFVYLVSQQPAFALMVIFPPSPAVPPVTPRPPLPPTPLAPTKLVPPLPPEAASQVPATPAQFDVVYIVRPSMPSGRLMPTG